VYLQAAGQNLSNANQSILSSDVMMLGDRGWRTWG